MVYDRWRSFCVKDVVAEVYVEEFVKIPNKDSLGVLRHREVHTLNYQRIIPFRYCATHDGISKRSELERVVRPL
jgi:hypothetical protein